MIQRCYPGGKTKAFNVTYDDGVMQDVRFVELLNRYGLKGTFNLNSQLMEQEFEWVHESGMLVKRLSCSAARGLYIGHEIASHTLTHPYMHDKSEHEIMWELSEDKCRLEAIFGTEVAGFAVPFDYYSDRIARCVRRCGFEYGRVSEESRDYSPWQEPYFWRTGLFHLSADLRAYVDAFLQTEQELAMCQIVGHSYDLDAEGLWDEMESVFRKISEDDRVLPMTHIEIVRYIRAMEQTHISENFVRNGSNMDLWFRVHGNVVMLCPGQCIEKGKEL